VCERERDQVSHPHKTKGKIRVLYILIFKVWRGDRKTKDSELAKFPEFNHTTIHEV
jgi:hypothetical protein